jgi:hypothetical protein
MAGSPNLILLQRKSLRFYVTYNTEASPELLAFAESVELPTTGPGMAI